EGAALGAGAAAAAGAAIATRDDEETNGTAEAKPGFFKRLFGGGAKAEPDTEALEAPAEDVAGSGEAAESDTAPAPEPVVEPEPKPAAAAEEEAPKPKPKRKRSSGSRKVPKEAVDAATSDDGPPKVGDQVQLKVSGGKFDAGTRGTVVDVFSAGVIVDPGDTE